MNEPGQVVKIEMPCNPGVKSPNSRVIKYSSDRSLGLYNVSFPLEAPQRDCNGMFGAVLLLQSL